MGESSGGKTNNMWSLLPSFDPAADVVREYIETVKFIDAICPKKDRPMLGPRLTMLCKGTAWAQARAIPAETLTDPDKGVKALLEALASWEETSEMKTYELFEKLTHKTTQKADETVPGFVNRLDVAFNELKKSDVSKYKAFLLLRQSALSVEDRKRALTMTAGEMSTKKTASAMGTLATNVLSNGMESKKKVYPTNFVDNESPPTHPHQEGEHSVAMMATADDEELDYEYLETLAASGDMEAINMMSFENDLEGLFQEVPDLHQALISYQDARAKILERKRGRGFWPSSEKGRGKGSFFQNKGGKKGAGKGGLLARIARTRCRACGEIGHWKAERPSKLCRAPGRQLLIQHILA